jgi:hypothetical protein
MFQGLSLRNTGFLGGQRAKSFRYWRLKNTSFGSTAIGVALSEWQMISPTVSSLVDKTLVNIGAAFDPPYPMSRINDGLVDVSTDSARIGYVSINDGYMDIYADLGSVTTVYGYALAPQGTTDTVVYNAPLSFEAYGSNDATDWTLVATFSSITTTIPDWNPGTYRQFLF